MTFSPREEGTRGKGTTNKYIQQLVRVLPYFNIYISKRNLHTFVSGLDNSGTINKTKIINGNKFICIYFLSIVYKFSNTVIYPSVGSYVGHICKKSIFLVIGNSEHSMAADENTELEVIFIWQTTKAKASK